MRRRLLLVLTTAVLAGAWLPAAALPAAPDPVLDAATAPTVPPARETEPVVLTGTAFGDWAAPADASAKVPSASGVQCTSGSNACPKNRYEDPEVTTGDQLGTGVAVDALRGYRWNGKKFVQIPLQVDELAVRYLSNDASTFSVYSQTDQHLTYVFDEERFRWTESHPEDPCRAVPAGGRRTTADSVAGLDHNDEVVFMAADAGPAAPADAALPKGVVGVQEVRVADPLTGATSYAYVMLAGDKGPDAEYDATNGYVRYQPDVDSDTYLYSQSAYGSYGNTYRGAYYDEATRTCVTDAPRQRRPKDTAWIKTPTYAFRYDGRWLMTQTRVAPRGVDNDVEAPVKDWVYGPDVIDQWKARAFQQRPGGQTPCCGYEEEVNNWGGSSMLMGVKAGPVRVIRATWGSDSATNNVRTEVFYRDEIRQLHNLRVHVIPPADGIYAQWDFNGGRMDTYYNPYVADGVAVDGRNDEVFGNGRVFVGSEGVRYSSDDPTPVVGDHTKAGVGVGSAPDRCSGECINNDIDTVDPTHSGPNGALSYEQITGPFGTFVDRTTIKQVTAGAGYSVVTTPYYRDDSCFDDGTGTDPGLHVKPRATDPVVDSEGNPRACWTPEDGDPSSIVPRDRFFQGSIGTFGLHILLIADSDNAFTTLPLTEIASETRRVVLAGRQPNVGERYGRGAEKPLAAVVVPRG